MSRLTLHLVETMPDPQRQAARFRRRAWRIVLFWVLLFWAMLFYALARWLGWQL